MRLQEEAERAFPGAAGAVVAMDVSTGFILALVSRPGFDPNLLTGRVTPAQMATLAKDPLQPMINRVAARALQPGLHLQGRDRAGGLQVGRCFRPETVVNCPGGYRLGARMWRCHKDSGHGPGGRQAARCRLVRHLVLQGGGHHRAGPHRGDGQGARPGRSHRHRRGGRGAGHHAGQRVPRQGLARAATPRAWRSTAPSARATTT